MAMTLDQACLIGKQAVTETMRAEKQSQLPSPDHNDPSLRQILAALMALGVEFKGTGDGR